MPRKATCEAGRRPECRTGRWKTLPRAATSAVRRYNVSGRIFKVGAGLGVVGCFVRDAAGGRDARERLARGGCTGSLAAVGLETVVEGLEADPEHLGGATLVAAGLLER